VVPQFSPHFFRNGIIPASRKRLPNKTLNGIMRASSRSRKSEKATEQNVEERKLNLQGKQLCKYYE
jgi:hypothetical protein